MHRINYYALLTFILSLFSVSLSAHDYFKIQVVDEATQRGVPLVELKTTNAIRYYTDSNGIVAFYEPGLMGKEVFFHVSSDGYEYPKDGFGYRGVRLTPQENEEATIEIRRINIAQRLYRMTGQGIYRDSLLAGAGIPIENGQINGRVMGQDTAFASPYKDKIYWFWGDTHKPSYPLGQFMTSGATAPLPEDSEIETEEGINLDYFVDESGFSKKMAPVKESGLIWLDALFTIQDNDHTERLVARYSHLVELGNKLGHGLVIFNDEKDVFEELSTFSLEKEWAAPFGQAFRVTEPDGDYIYFAGPFPNRRVRAEWDAIQDQTAYEMFTCLKAGETYRGADSNFDYQNGKLHYSWKTNTEAIGPEEESELIEAGVLERGNARFLPKDIETGKTVMMHAGSVRWNEYRQKWIQICGERGGSSLLGETWYAEADEPTGPWEQCQKIVTHDKYSFYNVVQHPFLNENGGRTVYFEGTYTSMFTDTQTPAPRYDYNQIMYKLNLDDLAMDKME